MEAKDALSGRTLSVEAWWRSGGLMMAEPALQRKALQGWRFFLQPGGGFIENRRNSKRVAPPL